jgi:hypothetical protein
MNPWRWVDSRIQNVRVANVQSYLLRRGWKLEPNSNSNLLRFERLARGNGPPLFQMVPSSEEFADFRQRVAELITTLSELEDRHPVAVLEDILREQPAGGDNAAQRVGAETIRE